MLADFERLQTASFYASGACVLSASIRDVADVIWGSVREYVAGV